ncbi:MAG TPA: rod shape-determining protein RodA [Candidatus Aminicenantes bacterium]|jgi:rod shape determining protein RodA|nr:rod shape-determining protein RodA [Candidatus Aminicenantes bacterium]
MIDRRLIENIDWFLIGLLVLNSLLGVVVIYSASHYVPGNYHVRQLFFIGASLLALFVLLLVDYQVLMTFSFYFYGAVVFVLLMMLVFGRFISKGSWIKLRYFQIQPSELAKIALILVLAHLFAEYKRKHVSATAVLTSSGLVALPFLLVAMQPDLGTAVSFLPLLLGSLILAGLRRNAVVWILLLALLAGVAGWNFYLKDYQKKRLATVVFPSRDPQGAGYHILQSKIAIGSGGFLGKGFARGSQSQLKFLPARHTDFVFSVIGEEFGFIGVVGILFLYYLFLWRLFRSAGKSRDRAGVYVTFMVSLMIAFQLLVNVAMVIGIFPIVGIPLPLLSYGGSSLLANYLGVGLVLNVKMRRFANI